MAMRFLFLAMAVQALAAQPLDELVAEALANNPSIVAAQKRYEAARQRPSQVSSLPDPMFSPSYNANGRPWPGAGLGVEPTSNIGFSVGQEIPFPGKRRLAGQVASKEAEIEFQDYQQTQFSVIARLKQAYYRRSFTFSAIESLNRNLMLLEKLLRVTEIRYAAGKATQADVLKTQTQISILETRRIPLERERDTREAEIVTLLNRAPGSKLGAPVEMKPVPIETDSAELHQAALHEAPMLVRDEKKIQRAELALNQARKGYYPDFNVRGGYYNMGRMPDMYMFGVDFKIPLYFFRKQRPAVAEQAHQLVEARKNYEAGLQMHYFDIKNDLLMARSSLQLAEMYSKTVIPQASLTLESALASYETGAVDLLTVLNNYITIVEYEMNYWEELQNLHVALSRLEEVTGRKLLP
jgi:outer membrane protein, heavy metal efflux system